MLHVFNHYISRRSLTLAAVEVVVLLLAAQLAFLLFFGNSLPASLGGQGAAFLQAAAFAAGMWLILSSMGLYQSDLWRNFPSMHVRLAVAFLLGLAVVWAAAQLAPTHNTELVAAGAATVAFALTGSLVVRTAFHRWEGVAAFKPRVLVLGTGSRVARLAEYSQRNLDHRIVGYVSLLPGRHYVPESLVLALQPGETLLSLARRHRVDRIVVAVRDRRGGGLPLDQLLECRMNGIEVMELPSFVEREYRQVILESLNPSWMVLGEGFRQSPVRTLIKRAFDLTASLALLIVCLPVLLVAALCIFLESGKPVLYRQERVGRDGRVFTLIKLRSMRNDAEGDGTARWAEDNDERTTRVGQFLRKSRIDELPQLLNVIRGEMSLVGPRPERPMFVDQLTRQLPYYTVRHCVKPGITGWAQVRYEYGASVDDAVEKLQYDLYYVKNHSLFLDVMILFSTIEVVLWGKGAR
jgi:sugar transferase (PEP-CTERM system associated)